MPRFPERDHLQANTAEPHHSIQLNTALALDERLFTAQEIADRLGVSERWVRDHATRRNPRIRAVKLGPLLRFRWPDVQALIDRLSADRPFKQRL
jgi:hypothetical protein